MNLRKNDLVKMFEEASKGYLPEFLNKILIPSGRGGVYAARDYITANCILAEIRKAAAEGKRVNQAEIKSKEDLKSILHPVTRFRLSMYTPMLAFRYDELTPQLQKKQFDDPDIIATCFTSSLRVRMANGSYKKIINVRVGDEVLAVDKNNNVVPSKVLSLYRPEGYQTVDKVSPSEVATLDHKYLTSEGWKNMNDTDKCMTVVMSDVQKKMLYGTLMGDATISKKSTFRIARSQNAQEYLEWQFKNLGLVHTGLVFMTKTNAVSLETLTDPKWSSLREKIYPEGKKVMSDEVKQNLSAPLLAAWYLDDGTLMTSNTVNPNARLCMNGFGNEDVQYVADYLKSQGFNVKVLSYHYDYEERRSQDIKLISFDWQSTVRFCDWIKEYVPKCMSYKTLGRYTDKVYKSELRELRLAHTHKPHRAKVYCFETEHGNFITGAGHVVHNCKQNGVRGVFIYSAGRSVLYSRNYSQKDCSLPEYWKNVAQEFKGDLPFAVDCEVKFEPDCDVQQELERFGLTTDSKLEAMSALLQMESSAAVKLQEEYERIHGKPLIVFRLITVLYYNGKDYRKRPLGEAYAVESEVVKYATERGLNLAQIKKVKGTRADKEAFLDAMLEQGEEGVVFHNLKSRYITTENRDRNGFVKLKRSVSDTLAKNGMGDTIDGFITGFTMSKPGTADEGLIGSYEISAYIKDAKGNKRKQVIAYVPNIPREQKIQFTTMDAEGNPTLEPMLYGQVVEVNGQEVSRVSKRLTHPRLLRMRYDKNEEDCVYTEEFWNSQMDVSLTEVSRKYNKDI